MVDNICKRWEMWKEIQSNGQFSLIQETYDNNTVSESQNEDMAKEHFSQYNEYTSISEALANFFVKYGPICRTGDIEKILKKFEKEEKLSISRKPDITKKGHPSTFMKEDRSKGQTVSIRWNS